LKEQLGKARSNEQAALSKSASLQKRADASEAASATAPASASVPAAPAPVPAAAPSAESTVNETAVAEARASLVHAEAQGAELREKMVSSESAAASREAELQRLLEESETSLTEMRRDREAQKAARMVRSRGSSDDRSTADQAAGAAASNAPESDGVEPDVDPKIAAELLRMQEESEAMKLRLEDEKQLRKRYELERDQFKEERDVVKQSAEHFEDLCESVKELSAMLPKSVINVLAEEYGASERARRESAQGQMPESQAARRGGGQLPYSMVNLLKQGMTLPTVSEEDADQSASSDEENEADSPQQSRRPSRRSTVRRATAAPQAAARVLGKLKNYFAVFANKALEEKNNEDDDDEDDDDDDVDEANVTNEPIVEASTSISGTDAHLDAELRAKVSLCHTHSHYRCTHYR
jgi:hypothetical protein